MRVHACLSVCVSSIFFFFFFFKALHCVSMSMADERGVEVNSFQSAAIIRPSGERRQCYMLILTSLP